MKKLLRQFDKKKLFLRLLYFALAVVILIFIIIRVFGTQKDSSCVFYKTIPAEREELAADFEELVQASDLIVRAKVLPDKEDVFVQEGVEVPFGYTLTKLEITGTFQGAQDDKIIVITEEYYTKKDKSGTTIWSQGNYLPAKVGEEYLFFLKAYEEDSDYAGMYFPVDLERGKYVLAEKVFPEGVPEKPTAEVLELKNKKGLSKYLEFYTQVAENYGSGQEMVTWRTELPDYMRISEVPKDYTLGQAWRDGCVIILASPKRDNFFSPSSLTGQIKNLKESAVILYGRDLWKLFYNRLFTNGSAVLRIAYFSELEKERLGEDAKVKFLFDVRKQTSYYEAVYMEEDSIVVESYEMLAVKEGVSEENVCFLIDDPRTTYREILDYGDSVFSSSSSIKKKMRFWMVFFW